jgi:dolichyl-phosphate-mannose-protein mannosyltransferase
MLNSSPQNFWVKDHHQIYLIGNPFVWYLSTLAIGAYVAVRGFLILRQKRGYRDFDNSTSLLYPPFLSPSAHSHSSPPAKVTRYDALCGFFFMGWALHYLPFFLMQRQLFLHHYFPALYFAILLLCSVFDLITSTLRPRIRLQIALVFIAFAIWNFYHLSPLAYGLDWTRGQCEKAKWVKTWDFSCNDFYTDVSSLFDLLRESC